MKDHRHDAESAIPSSRVAWLAHVIACESILDVEVHVEHIVDVILLDDALKFLVLAADLLHVLRV